METHRFVFPLRAPPCVGRGRRICISLSLYVYIYTYIYSIYTHVCIWLHMIINILNITHKERKRSNHSSPARWPCRVRLAAYLSSATMASCCWRTAPTGHASDVPWEIHRNCRGKLKKTQISKFQGWFCYEICVTNAPDSKLCVCACWLFFFFCLEVSIMMY